MAEQLIFLSDIIALKPRVSINIVPEHIVNQMIIDAQRLDIRPALGQAFYLELVNALDSSPVAEKFSDLFSGTTYERSDGLTVDFFGLKPAIVNFAFARLLESNNNFHTRSGAKYKDTDTSTRIEQQQLVSWVNTARSQAVAYMNWVNDYLLDQRVDFPIWVKDCQINRDRSIQSFSNKKNPTNIRTRRFFRSKKYGEWC